MDDGIARRSDQDGSGRTRGAPELDARVTRVIPLLEEMVGEYRPALMASLLVLLIACVNVAGLLLARGVIRRRELAVRGALGAGRGRSVRQLLTESVLLGPGGGALGLATAAAVLRAVPALVPVTVTRLDEVGLDGVVLAFTLGLSVAVGLLFGVVPAFQSSGSRLLRALVEGSERSSGGFGLLRANRTRAVLAAAQMALALMLLVGADLLLGSFVGLVTLERGYDPANVVAAGTRYPLTVLAGLGPRRSASRRKRRNDAFYVELAGAMDRVSRLPGVEAVGVSSRLPLASAGSVMQQVQVDSGPAADDPRELPQALLRVATAGYFDAMRLRSSTGACSRTATGPVLRGSSRSTRRSRARCSAARRPSDGRCASSMPTATTSRGRSSASWPTSRTGGSGARRSKRKPPPRYSRSTPLPCSSTARPRSWPGPPAIRSPRSRSSARRWPRRAPAPRSRR